VQQTNHNSPSHTLPLASGAHFATVEHAELGRPVTVKIGALAHTIELVNSQLPHIQVGDLVMVQNCQGILVVTQQLQRLSDEPAPQWKFADNSWQLSCQQTLKFQCGNARIELQPNGQVVIEGRDLLSYAERVNRIQGTRIELN